MNGKIVDIDTTSIKDGVTYYKISIRIPLRHIVIERRYSEFEELVRGLSDYLGISQKEFPYKLPPKGSWFNNKSESLIQTRKSELSNFLNSVVKDQSIQNIYLLHKFLDLPNNFKFKPALLKESYMKAIDLNIDERLVDNHNWLALLNILKANIEELEGTYSSDSSISSKIYIRKEIHRNIKPNVTKLENSLKKYSSLISSDELLKRKSKLKKIREDVDHLEIQLNQSHDERNVDVLGSNDSLKRVSRREIGSNIKESQDTLGVSNQDLLSTQVQVHKQQDQELEQLREVIARQREIGELINNEVEEQNQLLDAFNQEVDTASDKIKSARRRAKKIL